MDITKTKIEVPKFLQRKRVRLDFCKTSPLIDQSGIKQKVIFRLGEINFETALNISENCRSFQLIPHDKITLYIKKKNKIYIAFPQLKNMLIKSIEEFGAKIRSNYKYKYIHQKQNDINITEKDYSKLNDSTYINDVIANFGFKLIEDNYSINGVDDVVSLRSFFYNFLQKESDYEPYTPLNNFERTNFSKTKLNIFKFRIVLVPMCEKSHWSFLIIRNPINIKNIYLRAQRKKGIFTINQNYISIINDDNENNKENIQKDEIVNNNNNNEEIKNNNINNESNINNIFKDTILDLHNNDNELIKNSYIMKQTEINYNNFCQNNVIDNENINKKDYDNGKNEQNGIKYNFDSQNYKNSFNKENSINNEEKSHINDFDFPFNKIEYKKNNSIFPQINMIQQLENSNNQNLFETNNEHLINHMTVTKEDKNINNNIKKDEMINSNIIENTLLENKNIDINKNIYCINNITSTQEIKHINTQLNQLNIINNTKNEPESNLLNTNSQIQNSENQNNDNNETKINSLQNSSKKNNLNIKIIKRYITLEIKKEISIQLNSKDKLEYPEIYNLDSIFPSNPKAVMIIKKFLFYEFNLIYPVFTGENKNSEVKDCIKNYHYLIRDYTPKVPKQTNNYDCGIYMIIFAEMFLFDREMFFINGKKFKSLPENNKLVEHDKWFFDKIIKNKRKEFKKLIDDIKINQDKATKEFFDNEKKIFEEMIKERNMLLVDTSEGKDFIYNQ